MGQNRGVISTGIVLAQKFMRYQHKFHVCGGYQRYTKLHIIIIIIIKDMGLHF